MIRCCFKCKEYIHIFPDNPMTLQAEKAFDAYHSGHTVQTIKFSEIIEQNYKCIIPGNQ